MDKKMIARGLSLTIVLLLLSITLCVFASGSASAENDLSVPLSGKVVDSNGDPLAGINVALENGTSVNTDSLGDFMILCTPGEHTLTFSGSGIADKDLLVNVGDSGLSMGNVETYESNEGADMTMNILLIVAGLAVTGLVVFFFLKKKKKA